MLQYKQCCNNRRQWYCCNNQAATTKKSDAKAEIAQKASERKTAIEAMNDSTSEEQQAAKDKVDQAVVTANADIDNAAANSDVDNAKLQMKQSQPLHLMQTSSKQADKVQAQETAIDANNGAITEEKQLRNNKFKLKTTADTAIDGAHSNAEVEAAKMQKLLEAIQPATTTKDNAKQAIATKANERKQQSLKRKTLQQKKCETISSSKSNS